MCKLKMNLHKFMLIARTKSLQELHEAHYGFLSRKLVLSLNVSRTHTSQESIVELCTTNRECSGLNVASSATCIKKHCLLFKIHSYCPEVGE